MMQKLDTLKQQLLAETAKIPFKDLQRFFATGQAIFVSDNINLIDAAATMANDKVDHIHTWMKEHKITKVTDAQALDWIENNSSVWAVVVKPWVLVQAIQ